MFFSGGTALRATSRALKRLTHNSVHLVTPFDSGGSSARLRAAFAMPAVGDLRNRLIALADEGARGSPEIYRLFSHRFALDVENAPLRAAVAKMATGDHALVHAVPEPMRQLIVTHLHQLVTRIPDDFDYRGASVGNLVLVVGYLENARDIDALIYLFSQLVGARGLVRPVVNADLHLAADLDDGTKVVGQHQITAPDPGNTRAAIKRLSLVDTLEKPQPAQIVAREYTAKLIQNADVICFPMGSFFSSVVANLLPRGIGSAVAAAPCPKIFVPNMRADVEQRGMTIADAVETLVETVRDDVAQHSAEAARAITPADVVNLVLLDARDTPYCDVDGLAALSAMGIDVVRTALAHDDTPDKVDPKVLSEILVSLA